MSVIKPLGSTVIIQRTQPQPAGFCPVALSPPWQDGSRPTTFPRACPDTVTASMDLRTGFVRGDHEVASDPSQLMPRRLLAMPWCYWVQQEDSHRFKQGQDLAWWKQTERLRQQALLIAQNHVLADGHQTVFTKKAKPISQSRCARQPSFCCLSYKSKEGGVRGTDDI